MKKSEVPQDDSSLKNVNAKELYYVVNENGSYETAQSTGWEPKAIALDNTLKDIEERIQDSKNKVLNNETSPIEYYMELHRMDVSILAGYTNFFAWCVKRHMKPKVFNKLSQKKLQRYADVFEISINKLKDIEHED